MFVNIVKCFSVSLVLFFSAWEIKAETFISYTEAIHEKIARDAENEIKNQCLAFDNSKEIDECTKNYADRKAIRANAFYERAFGRIQNDEKYPNGLRNTLKKYFDLQMAEYVKKQCGSDCSSEKESEIKNLGILRLTAYNLAANKLEGEIKDKKANDFFTSGEAFDAQKFKNKNPHLAGIMTDLCDQFKGQDTKQFDCYKKNTENELTQLHEVSVDFGRAVSETISQSQAVLFCKKNNSSNSSRCFSPNISCDEVEGYYKGLQKYKEQEISIGPKKAAIKNKCGNFPTWKDVILPYKQKGKDEIDKVISHRDYSPGNNAYLPPATVATTGPGKSDKGIGNGGGGNSESGNGDDKKEGHKKMADEKGRPWGTSDGLAAGAGTSADAKCDKKNPAECLLAGVKDWGAKYGKELDCPYNKGVFDCGPKDVAGLQSYSQMGRTNFNAENFCVVEYLKSKDLPFENAAAYSAKDLDPKIDKMNLIISVLENLKKSSKNKTEYSLDDHRACDLYLKSAPEGTEKNKAKQYLQSLVYPEKFPVSNQKILDLSEQLSNVFQADMQKDLGSYMLRQRASAVLAMQASKNIEEFCKPKNKKKYTEAVQTAIGAGESPEVLKIPGKDNVCNGVDSTRKDIIAQFIQEESDTICSKLQGEHADAEAVAFAEKYKKDLYSQLKIASDNFTSYGTKLHEHYETYKRFGCDRADSKDHLAQTVAANKRQSNINAMNGALSCKESNSQNAWAELEKKDSKQAAKIENDAIKYLEEIGLTYKDFHFPDADAFRGAFKMDACLIVDKLSNASPKPWSKYKTENKLSADQLEISATAYASEYSKDFKILGYTSKDDFKNKFKVNPCDGLGQLAGHAQKQRAKLVKEYPLLAHPQTSHPLPGDPKNHTKEDDLIVGKEECPIAGLGGQAWSKGWADALDYTPYRVFVGKPDSGGCIRRKMFSDVLALASTEEAKDAAIKTEYDKVFKEELQNLRIICNNGLEEEGKRASGFPGIVESFLTCEDKKEDCKDMDSYSFVLCRIYENRVQEKQKDEIITGYAMMALMAGGILTGGALSAAAPLATAVFAAAGLALTGVGSIVSIQERIKTDKQNTAKINTFSTGVGEVSWEEFKTAWEAETVQGRRAFMLANAIDLLSMIPDAALLVDVLKPASAMSKLEKAEKAYDLLKAQSAAGKLPPARNGLTYTQNIAKAHDAAIALGQTEKAEELLKASAKYIENAKAEIEESMKTILKDPSAMKLLKGKKNLDLSFIKKLHPDDVISLRQLGMKADLMISKAGKNIALTDQIKAVMLRLGLKLEELVKSGNCTKG